jgi:hypothetical protein
VHLSIGLRKEPGTEAKGLEAKQARAEESSTPPGTEAKGAPEAALSIGLRPHRG